MKNRKSFSYIMRVVFGGILIALLVLSSIRIQKWSDNVIEERTENNVTIPTVTPSPTLQPKNILLKPYIVTADKLNIRKEPSIESEIIGTLTKDTKIGVIEIKDSWAETEMGFINIDYISEKKEYERRIYSYRISRGSKLIVPLTSVQSPVNQNSNLTLDEVKIILKDSKLEHLSEFFIETEEKYSINAFFIIAVAKLESANGTSKIAIAKNNLFGIGAYDSNPMKYAKIFESKRDSIHYFGNLIKNNYIMNGYITLKDINKKYSTSSSWADKVFNVIKYDVRKIKR